MRESTTLRRLRVPAHWRLLSFCFGVAVVAILFEGIATHTVGPSAEPRQALGGPAPLVHSRPILAARGSHLVSTQPSPGRRVALTFDDGPDPRWTPKIAAILRRNHVPATFFVIGSEAARHPDLVRLLVRDGNELGNHTFTHVFLSGVPSWEGRLQIELTEAVISGTTIATDGACSAAPRPRLVRTWWRASRNSSTARIRTSTPITSRITENTTVSA